jgi:hypothetical protein
MDTYVTSQNAKLKISEMGTPHIINAIAKLHREIYGSQTSEEWCDAQSQIVALDNELLKRESLFWENRFGADTDTNAGADINV